MGNKFLYITILILSVTNSKGQQTTGITLTTDDLYYTPTIHNLPMFQEKKEFHLSAFLGTTFGFNAAFAVSPHFDILGNVGYTQRNSTQVRYIEGGAGYFNHFGVNKLWNYGASLLGGYGYADVNNYKGNNGQGIAEELTHYKGSIQFNLGIKTDYVESAFSPRITYSKFRDLEKKYTGQATNLLYGDILEDKEYTVLETSFLIRVGGKNVKMGTQLVLPVLLSGRTTRYFHDKFILEFSLNVRIRTHV